MRYVGGKARISKWVAENVLSVAAGKTHYIEPFVGSGATFAAIAPHFPESTARDAHADLMLMWRALAEGWEPPEHVSREEYARLKAEKISSALRYVDTSWDSHWQRYTKPYLNAARKSVLKTLPIFELSHLRHASYESLKANDSMLIYCDPPYAGTLGYGGTKFDPARFWAKAREWVDQGATVVVSESAAPADWPLLAMRERKAMLRVAKGGENETRREILVWREF